MELHELHVLQGQTKARHHAVAVAGAGVGARCGEIGAAVAAGSQHDHLCGEAVDRAVVEVPGDHARHGAVRVGDQVEREIFDEELRVVLHGLAIERVQDGVTGAVGRRAGALHRRTGAKIHHVAAKGALVDFSFFRAGEGHAVVLKLVDGGRRLASEVFHGVHVAQPVRAFDGVVHVPLPAIRPHVLERGGNAPLRGDRVRARRKDLRDAGGLQALLGHAKRGAQARAAGAHHDDVKLMVDSGIAIAGRGTFLRHHQAPKASFRIAKAQAAPTAIA